MSPLEAESAASRCTPRAASVARHRNLDPAEYVAKVRQHCGRATYDTFLAILKDFSSGTSALPDVASRIVTALAGHDDLLRDFPTFLPASLQREYNAQLRQAKKDRHSSQGSLKSASNAKALRKIRQKWRELALKLERRGVTSATQLRKPGATSRVA